MASSTNKDEVIELAEGLDSNCPINTEPQEPGSSAKCYASESLRLELLMTRFEGMINHFDNQLEEKNDERKAVQVQIKELTHRIESLRTLLEKQLREKENERKDATAESDTHNKEVQNLKSENQKLTTELASCKDARTELNKMMTEKDEAIKKLQEEAAAELNTHKKGIQNLKSENQKLTTELAHCKEARPELNKIITEKEEAIKNLQKLQKEAAAELETLKNGMQTLKFANQKLTTELPSCKKESEQTIKLLQSENSDLPKQIAEVDANKKEIETLKEHLVSDDSHRKLSEVDLQSSLRENSTSSVIHNRMINYVAPGTFDNLSSLTELQFTWSGLTFLEKGVFNNLTNLIYLFLHDNYLTSLEENVFEGLKKLKNISLSNNNITKFPPQLFRGLESLEEISLGSNKIAVLDEDLLVGLNRLTYFSARNNNLTSIPEKLFEDCVQLQKVYLSNNKIVRLKKTIFDSLYDLTELKLQNNLLNEMDKNALRMLTIDQLII